MADQNQLAGILDVFGIYEGGRKRAEQEQRQKIVNQLYGQALNTRTGQIDYPSVYQGLAREGMAAAIPEMQKEEYERRRAYAETMGTEAENIIKKMDMFKKSIPATPGEAQVWVDRAYSDPDVGPLLSLFGSREEAIAAVPRDMGEFDRWRVNSALFADEVIKTEKADLEGGIGYIRPATGEQVGETVMKVPYDPELAEQKRRQAAAGVPRPPESEKKFSGTLGETAAKRLDNFREKAESAATTIQTSRQLLPLLDDPRFISGTFADAKLAIARALNIDVSSTEAYFGGIGQQVAERITAFGAGTGLSDADRDFAKSIAGGNPVTTVEGIRRIIRINNESSRNVINRYNDERKRLSGVSNEVLNYYPEISVPRQVKRTGKFNNRNVVEYDDGSVEYVD